MATSETMKFNKHEELMPLLDREEGKDDLGAINIADFISEEKKYWLDAINHAQSAEAVHALREQMLIASDVLAKYDLHASEEWADACEVACKQRIPHLPSTSLMSKLTWPTIGLAIAGIAVAILFPPVLAAVGAAVGVTIAVTSISAGLATAITSLAVGVMSLGYSVGHAKKKHEDLQHAKQISPEMKQKAQARWRRAKIGLALGITAIVLGAAIIFTGGGALGLIALGIGAVACVPALRDVRSGIMDHFSQKKEVANIQVHGLQKLDGFKRQLDLEAVKKEALEKQAQEVEGMKVHNNQSSETMASEFKKNEEEVIAKEKGFNETLEHVKIHEGHYSQQMFSEKHVKPIKKEDSEESEDETLHPPFQ